MVGITSYGAYVPFFRLARADISKAWQGMPGMGEKAVANLDEDSITMAVAAGFDCLGDTDPKKLDGLYLATTTCPFMERNGAGIVASATPGASIEVKQLFPGKALDLRDTEGLRLGDVNRS